MTRTDLSQGTVRRHEDLEIPILGERVAATRYEPVEAPGPQPALLLYIPYHKDDWISYGAYDPSIEYLASRGYEVVVADMVGTGASTGHIEEMFEGREGREAAAIVRWLADQPWTDGHVGMFGKSYGGFTSLYGAAEAPDPLEAIVPIETPYEGYRNAFTYGGGFELETIGMHWLTLMQVLDVKPPSRRVGNWAAVWEDRLDAARHREPWLLQFLSHQAKDGYWAGKDVPVDDITVPTLAVGGWRDPYTTDTLEYVDSLSGPTHLLMGPWRHTMPHRGHEVAIDFRRRMGDWFDHFLRDEQTGVDEWPAVTVWTEGSAVDGSGRWDSLDALPAPDSPSQRFDTRAFTLTGSGLRDDQVDEAFDGIVQVDPTVGVDSVIPYDFQVSNAPTNGDDARALFLDSAPLGEPLPLTGSGELRVAIETEIEDPTVSARLVDIGPEGRGALITHGTVRARFREGLSEPEPIPAGEPATLVIPLEARSYTVAAGHRLRLALGGSFFPAVMPTGEPGSIRVHSTPDQPARLRLPVRSSIRPSTDPTVDFEPPAQSVPPDPDRVSNHHLDWTVDRNRSAGTVTVTRRGSNRVDLPHATMTESGIYTASVDEEDPASFQSSNELEFELAYPSSTVEIRASNSFSGDLVALSTEVVLDGTTVFDESWSGRP